VNRTVRFELHNAVTFGKKGKVIALPHKKTGTEAAAALADDNTSRGDKLASIGLHAKPLGIGVTTVGGTSLSFCMRHFDALLRLLCGLDFFDAQAQKILAVPFFTPRVFAPAETK